MGSCPVERSCLYRLLLCSGLKRTTRPSRWQAWESRLKKSEQKKTALYGRARAADLRPGLSVWLSVVLTSATTASAGISLLRKPCWRVTSRPKKSHYSVSCNALYKKDHARNGFCAQLFRHAKKSQRLLQKRFVQRLESRMWQEPSHVKAFKPCGRSN